MRALLLLCCLLPAMAAEPLPLRVAVGLSLPPYVIREQSAGLEYEIVSTALRRAGYQMKAQFVAYGRVGILLAEQSVDAAMTLNPQSGIKAHYSDVVVSYHDFAITLESRQISLKKPADLRAYSVLAFQNANRELGPEFAAVTQGHPRYSEAGQQIAQNKLLYSGKVDVVIADRLIFNYYRQLVHGEVDARQPVVFHPLFQPIDYAVGFLDAKVRDQFNGALADMRRDGELGRIRQKYQPYF